MKINFPGVLTISGNQLHDNEGRCIRLCKRSLAIVISF